MGKPKKKPLIGIVGGIASGKSTVAAEFERCGCARIDADAIVSELLAEPTIRARIVRRFGPTVVDAGGAIDRRRLAALAFSGAKELAALHDILHPAVLERIEDLIEQYAGQANVPAVVLDAPLLVEVGWAHRCDRIVFVDCAWERRVQRALSTGRLTEQDVKIRENFQISLDTKAGLADNTVDNNSDFSALVSQIHDIFSDITKKS